MIICVDHTKKNARYGGLHTVPKVWTEFETVLLTIVQPLVKRQVQVPRFILSQTLLTLFN